MIYLYAITDDPEVTTLPESGIGGASLLTCAYRDVAAVISPMVSAEIEPTADNVWRHEEIVEALMAESAVLPVRFGTVLADRTAVQATLAVHYSRFVTNLDRVRGRVELGLRVLWDDDGCPTDKDDGGRMADSGRAYLMARVEKEHQVQASRQRGEALAAELDARLADLAVQSTHRALVTPRLLLTAAYLVEQDQVVPFQQRVRALGAAYPALRFLCTGPWPPYSFVGAVVSTANERER